MEGIYEGHLFFNMTSCLDHFIEGETIIFVILASFVK